MSFIISLILYLLRFLSSKKIGGLSKLRPFECGFSVVGPVFSSFSVHFYMLTLIFVVFEMEIALLLGCMYSVRGYSFTVVIVFVLGGVYLEYYLGKLSWMVWDPILY